MAREGELVGTKTFEMAFEGMGMMAFLVDVYRG